MDGMILQKSLNQSFLLQSELQMVDSHQCADLKKGLYLQIEAYQHKTLGGCQQVYPDDMHEDSLVQELYIWHVKHQASCLDNQTKCHADQVILYLFI